MAFRDTRQRIDPTCPKACRLSAVSSLTFAEADAELVSCLIAKNWTRAEVIIRGVVNTISYQFAGKCEMRQYHDIPDKPERKAHPVVYLPIEIKSREWDAKLLIADLLAEAGLNVVLGQSWAVQKGKYHGWPPGIILFKTMNAFDGVNMRGAIANGHLIAAIDEEAFARAAQADLVRLYTDQWAIACADVICLQGPDHARVFAEVYPRAKDKLVVTGNPRADVRPEFTKPPASPGYALLCCMSGNINNTRGFSTCTYSTMMLSAQADLELARKIYLEQVLHELRILPLFLETINRLLSEYSQVIIRPHPVEGHEYWQHMLSGQDRANITNQDSVQSWIKHAGHVVVVEHCGCAVEAKLLGVEPETISLERHKNQFITDGHMPPGRSAPRVVEAIKNLYAAHKTSDPLPELAHRKSGFVAKAFHRNKFPVTSLGEVQTALPKRNVYEVEENVFLVRP